MQIAYDPDNFVVEEFYKYPTCVIHRIVEYAEGSLNSHRERADHTVKSLFDDLLKCVEQQLGQVRDNKIAMKVLYKPTNTTLYIGYKDWNWCVGLALNPHMTGECVKLTALAG